MTVIDGEGADIQERIRSLLRSLLETGLVEAVLVPRALPDGVGFTQTVVTDPNAIAETVPLAPTMPVHSSRILSDLTPSDGGRIAAVLKPCELRAAIELDKFLQVDLNQVITIGVDCAGTFDVAGFAGLDADARSRLVDSYVGLYAGDATASGLMTTRTACTACNHTAPESADLSVLIYGLEAEEGTVLVAGNDLSDEDASKLPYEWSTPDEDRTKRHDARVGEVVATRSKHREEVFDELRATVASEGGLEKILATCIRCHNCMNVCPICYCKECVFESSVFRHNPSHFVHLSKRKQTARMPSDTMIFHLTRMSHMGTSCVSCGMCESACPADIPVSRLFSMVGGDLQKMFDYVPGMSRSEDPPVKVFKEQELGAGLG